MEPTADEVRLQLDRILASEGFANADRMSGFLRYVVDRSLAGEGDRVKEYAIGIDVFGRNNDYDPRLDSIVRVEARRLRAKVDEYYAGAGREDPVRILLRRGSYVPAFEKASVTPEVTAPAADTTPPPVPVRRGRNIMWRVGLGLAVVALVLVTIAARRGGLWASPGRRAPAFSAVVLPFAEYSNDPADTRLAARLTDGITAQLARIGTVGVVSHTSAIQFGGTPRRPVREIASALSADFVVEGAVSRSGDRLDVSVRIVNAMTDRKFWVQDFVGSTSNPRELERNIAAALATQISSHRR